MVALCVKKKAGFVVFGGWCFCSVLFFLELSSSSSAALHCKERAS